MYPFFLLPQPLCQFSTTVRMTTETSGLVLQWFRFLTHGRGSSCEPAGNCRWQKDTIKVYKLKKGVERERRWTLSAECVTQWNGMAEGAGQAKRRTSLHKVLRVYGTHCCMIWFICLFRKCISQLLIKITLSGIQDLKQLNNNKTKEI